MNSERSTLTSTISRPLHTNTRRRWYAAGVALALAVASLAIGLFGQAPEAADAAAVPPQCNGVQNVGGEGIACTVTVDNYVSGAGVATAPSTVSVTTCLDAAGPIRAGATTSCVTTTTTSPEPVTLVDQCNGSGNGGGGVVICTVSVTNHFSSSPTGGITAATVYQCIPLPPGGNCTPVNTAASVGTATVGQCTGSGGGGTSAGFECTVFGASGMTTTLPVHVDQCNGSGTGGGAFVKCQASVTNQVAPPATSTATVTTSATATTTLTASATSTTATATLTASATSTTATATLTASATSTTATVTPTASSTAPSTATSTPTASSTVAPTATPTLVPVEVIVPIIPPGNDLPEIVPVIVPPGVVPVAPPNVIVVPPVVIPPGVVQVVVAPPVVIPPGVVQVILPLVAPPGVVPVIVPRVLAAPGAPATGNTGFAEREGTSQPGLWMLSLAVTLTTAGLALALVERQLSRRRIR